MLRSSGAAAVAVIVLALPAAAAGAQYRIEPVRDALDRAAVAASGAAINEVDHNALIADATRREVRILRRQGYTVTRERVARVRTRARNGRPIARKSDSSSADYLRVRVVGSTTSTLLDRRDAAANLNGAWTASNFNISAHLGQTVRIVIDAADASSASLVEAAVDDVRVTRS